MAHLEIVRGDRTETIPLDRDRLTIGRTRASDVRVDDALVSRAHAEVVRRDGGFVFRDLGSHNGSTLNGDPVGEHRLEHGDEIGVGSSILRFQDEVEALLDSPGEQRLEIGDDIAATWHNVRAVSAGPEEAEAALQRAVDRFELLDRVGRRVLSAASLDELLDVALALVLDAIRGERVALQLWDDEGKLERQVQRDSTGESESLRVPRSIVNEVVDGRVAVITSDAKHDERFRDGASVAASRIRSALCVPLWEEQAIHGVIYLDSLEHSYRFTRDDLELAAAISNLIAIRIKQERLNQALAEQRLVRSNLERYHSPEVVKAILSTRHGPAGLEQRDASILFGDIKGFTSIAERTDPTKVAELLNAYYELATEVVFAHGGTVNEYVGDSLMAIFGAPIAQQDHAERAVAAGLEILDRIDARNAEKSDDPARIRYELRVAINSGPVVVGSVGPPRRMKYAVVGDPVNVAARIERMGEAGTLLIGESTRAALSDSCRCMSLGAQALKGRTGSIEVFRVERSGDLDPST